MVDLLICHVSYASPTMVTLSLNLRGADDSVVGNAQFNNLVRQSQYILTQMVSADRHDELRAATERFGDLVEQYNEHLVMVKWQEQNVQKATENLQRANTSLESAKQFMQSSERQLELSQQNFQEKRGGLNAAQQSVKEILDYCFR